MSFNWKIFTDGDSVLRRLILITCLGLSVFFVSGCKKAKLRSQLKELMASTIVLPDKITCVNNGLEYPMPDSLRDRTKLIIYVDSTECTACRMNRIKGYQHLFLFSREAGSFDLVLLFPNVNLYGVAASRYLSDMEIDLPVYFDDDNTFLDLNPSVPNDTRLQSFLVDKAGSPLCVGDPAVSSKMFQFFLKTLDNVSD